MLLNILGSLLAAKVGLNLLLFAIRIIRLYGLPKLGFKLNLKKYGKFAVVTGSTDGIGKAIAEQLAARGLDLVLISRSKDKLSSTAQEIKAKHSVDVRTIEFDFACPDSYLAIENGLKGLDIGILVNNVGFSYDHPAYYLETTEKEVDTIMSVNCSSLLKVTRCVLSGMVERNRGLLVHVSSSSSAIPVPLLTVYSASKVFVSYFGRALHEEYKSKGIIGQVVAPYFVATKLSKIRNSSLLIPDSVSFAKSAVDAFGLTQQMTGFWSHEVQAFIASCMPDWIVIHHISSVMKSMRSRWLKRQEKAKGQ